MLFPSTPEAESSFLHPEFQSLFVFQASSFEFPSCCVVLPMGMESLLVDSAYLSFFVYIYTHTYIYVSTFICIHAFAYLETHLIPKIHEISILRASFYDSARWHY